MSGIRLTHEDLKKLAAIFSRPGMELLSAAAGDRPNILHLQLRINLAKLVDALAKLTKSAPVTVKLWIEASKKSASILRLRLVDLDLDRSELNLMIRPFVQNQKARELLFSGIPPESWLQVDPDSETIELDLNALLDEKKVPLRVVIAGITVDANGLELELAEIGATN